MLRPTGFIFRVSYYGSWIFVPGGAANSGWTSYPPLSNIATTGQTVWLWGMVMLITSSLLGSVNILVTVIQLRTKGMTWMKLPIFVWTQFITAFLLLLAFPPLRLRYPTIDGSSCWNKLFYAKRISR